MKKKLLALALALSALPTLAGVGLTELPGLGGDGPVTVYDPSSAPALPVTRGPFTMALAPQGAPVRGNGRLIVISHGSGGAPWVHSALARVLVAEGFVVAMPEHRGDNHKDNRSPGPDSWKQRPAEVSRAIDTVAAAPRFSGLLALDRVGLYGMSAGGHTALSLAGGRWSPQRFLQHCQAHIAEDFPACVGLFTRLTGGWLDGLKKTVALGVLRQRFDDPAWQVHTDARIRAIVAGVPLAADFEPASLSAPPVPLGLVTAGQDRWLRPRFHSEAVLRACSTCETIAHLPDAGHGFLLSPPVPPALLGTAEGELLNDPPGFDRSVLPEVDRKIAAFFRRHLLP